MALFVLAPALSTRSMAQGAVNSGTSDQVEVRTAVVIDLGLTETFAVVVIKDEQTGSIYSYKTSGTPNVSINDRVEYTLDRTSTATRIIIMHVIRK